MKRNESNYEEFGFLSYNIPKKSRMPSSVILWANALYSATSIIVCVYILRQSLHHHRKVVRNNKAHSIRKLRLVWSSQCLFTVGIVSWEIVEEESFTSAPFSTYTLKWYNVSVLHWFTKCYKDRDANTYCNFKCVLFEM